MFPAIDCHSHILPGIDDGARTPQESAEILSMLFSQNIRRVIATPHFRCHRDNVQDFCRRRYESFSALCRCIPPETADMIFLGAEVALEYGLSDIADIEDLCYEYTNCILLEFPYRPFNRWMIDEIINIAGEHNLTPVIAHIDRYTEVFSKSDYEEIFSMRGVIFQVNNEAFASRQARRIVDTLIKQDLPFIMGSDSHNTGSRKPNFDLQGKHLARYTPHPAAEHFMRTYI